MKAVLCISLPASPDRGELVVDEVNGMAYDPKFFIPTNGKKATHTGPTILLSRVDAEGNRETIAEAVIMVNDDGKIYLSQGTAVTPKFLGE